MSRPIEKHSIIIPHFLARNPLLDDTDEGAAFASFILDQTEVWVDRRGNVHALDLMSREYLLNVLAFLHDNGRLKPSCRPLTDRIRELLLEPER